MSSCQQTGDRVLQSQEVKGLREKADVALSQLSLWRLANTDQQGGHIPEMLKRMQLIMQFETGHIWKAIIQDEEMERLRAARLKCLLASHVMERTMTHFLLNHPYDEQANILLVFDNQDQFDDLLMAHPGRSDSMKHPPFHCVMTWVSLVV
jgi:hypothetical protein